MDAHTHTCTYQFPGFIIVITFKLIELNIESKIRMEKVVTTMTGLQTKSS